MPNTMPGNTMRGFVVKRIETLFSDPAEDMADLLTDLSTQTLHFDDILSKTFTSGVRVLDPAVAVEAAHLRHMKNDWFGRTGGPSNTWRGRWWRGTSRRGGHQPIDPIVRGGFWTALTLRNMINPRPPIRIVWACAGHHFEAHIHPTAEQITLLLLTPHEGSSVERAGMAEAGPFKNTPDTELYVIRRRIQNAQVARRSGYLAIPVINGVAPPGYPDPITAAIATGYYHPLEAEDPI